MAKENLLEAIGDIAREKGIPRDRLVVVISEAITAAARRKFRHYADIETRFNERSGDIEVYRYKTVAEMVEDPDNEISLEEARSLDQLAEPGDEVEYEIDNAELSRVIAQTARQLIFQKIREVERETVYENFKDRVGEVLNGIVLRTERNRTIISFNNTEAILYGRETIHGERFSNGEHVRVVLLDVVNDPKEPSQLVISRTHPLLLTKLFEMEVPEIYDGIVEIIAAAREPGRRAKVAVISHDPDVDPVGACVGMRGSRVQAIISELRGEKIDIIKWNEDLPTYVANALAPAELSRIKIDEDAREIDIEVEPDQLSLAIGRQGQNVRLASKLTGYKINVSSTQEQPLSLEEQIRERLLASQAALGSQPATGEAAGAEGAPTGPAAEEAAGPEGTPPVAEEAAGPGEAPEALSRQEEAMESEGGPPLPEEAPVADRAAEEAEHEAAGAGDGEPAPGAAQAEAEAGVEEVMPSSDAAFAEMAQEPVGSAGEEVSDTDTGDTTPPPAEELEALHGEPGAPGAGEEPGRSEPAEGGAPASEGEEHGSGSP